MTRRNRTGLVAIVLACTTVLAACAAGVRNTPHALNAAPPDASLGPGDAFEVTVYEEKELSGKYRVADDGQINFPLIGLISVAGQGPNEVARQLEAALRDKGVLRSPSVSVFVTDYASKRISVVGAVAHAGSFPITTGMTVVQALSLAGGLTPLASPNETIVTRRNVGKKLERYTVPVRLVTEGRQDDFALQAGDIVFVPERVF